jgi:hypothetical protein
VIDGSVVIVTGLLLAAVRRARRRALEPRLA